MRIATYNVNSVNKRLPYLLRWLDDRRPDVVGIQKIRVPEEKFPKQAFESLGYHAEPFCHKGDFGVGILSRKNPKVLLRGLPGQDELGARLLTVEIDGLEFSSIYAPYGKSVGLARKLAWIESLVGACKGDASPVGLASVVRRLQRRPA